MGWDGIPSVKVTEIEQNFHFLTPPLDDICFLCRAKAKLLLRGLTKALKSKQKWHSKVGRGSQNPLPLFNLRFIQQLFLFQVLRRKINIKTSWPKKKTCI